MPDSAPAATGARARTARRGQKPNLRAATIVGRHQNEQHPQHQQPPLRARLAGAGAISSWRQAQVLALDRVG